jgi:hypothetical protein
LAEDPALCCVAETLDAATALPAGEAPGPGADADAPFPIAGKGVEPSNTFAAEKSGAVSVSFFTRIEILRFDGSVGLFFTRSIWSA